MQSAAGRQHRAQNPTALLVGRLLSFSYISNLWVGATVGSRGTAACCYCHERVEDKAEGASLDKIAVLDPEGCQTQCDREKEREATEGAG